VEQLGLLKMDFLGLRTLTVIADTLDNIKKSRGEDVDVRLIPDKDEKTAKMLCDGLTGAVFQMESAGMTALVKDIHPEGFEDLIPTVALYRPGPLGSGMVQDFIEGRRGKKTITYLHPLLEPILKETFGVILYQEQVMQIVQVLAGFSLGQADLLRRAMGHKEPELLMKQKEVFLQGAVANNIEKELAERIFELLTHFANYGFNKSHSAAYALVAWQTAYLKAHYPAEFMAAMLTSVVDFNEKVTTYIELAKKMGVQILPPDINASSATFSVDGDAIRFGLAAVRNVGMAAITQIEKVRSDGGPFASLYDFCERVDSSVINKRVLESLIKCGAFDSFGAKRSQMLLVYEKILENAVRAQKDQANGQMGLFSDDVIETATEINYPDVPEEAFETILSWEKEIIGFYISGHPLDSYKDIVRNLVPIEAVLSGQKKDRQLVRIAGLVTASKKMITKKGDTMAFISVADFTHTIECIVFPNVFYESMDLLNTDTPVVLQGRVNTTDTGAKILADWVKPLKDYPFEYYISIPPGMATDENFEKLNGIFTKHHGDHTVYLIIKERNERIKTNSEYWMADDINAVREIEELFGKGNILKR
ncbi:DNA polymerase III subunit alpha, partial [Schwartzia sp. (in: firmicutes)]